MPSLVRPLLPAALAACTVAAGASNASAQLADTIPSQDYYVGVEQLYGGEFRRAQRTFASALRGGVKTLSAGGTVRWVDSICYHAMVGEVFYHWGQPQQALEQFNFACTLYLQYPRWMLRAQFSPQLAVDPTLARLAAPWGVSQRRATPGRFPNNVPVAQGQLDNTRAVQQGGVVMQPQYWMVDVAAINRAAALAIRRRNEILGPLGPHDSLSKNLAVQLARGGAPPNHWSGAWIDVLRGLALAGVGDNDQALQYLERGAVAAGQFDHPLTGVSLLEQGRIALAQGDYGAAAGLLAEAGYAAFRYGDVTTIDDSFRWGALNRLAANVVEIDPGLQPAAAAARRDRLDYVAARCQLALADELISAGDWKNAAAAHAAGVALLRDARSGVLGNFAAYLDARLQFQQGRDSAPAAMAAALTGQGKISLVNFQIGLANQMFDAQTLPTRVAGPVYEALLRDPSPAEAALRPLESMAVMLTPHEPAFHRWLLTALDRKNLAYAVEVTERAKRRRFHNALPWGGRINAVRDLVATPPERLSPEAQRQQGDVLSRHVGLGEALAAERELRQQLDQLWRPPLAEAAQGRATRLWTDYAAALSQREAELGRVASARVPAELAFPPFLPALELQKRLLPGQALLVFHDTPDGLLAILVTSKASAHWNCGPSDRLSPLASQFLRDLGSIDANHEPTTDDLTGVEWQASGARLFEALFGASTLSPAAVDELVIVPDGLTWYVPFEALVVEVEQQPTTLLSSMKIRYAPTAALAFRFEGPWRRVQRTGLAIGDLVPGDKPEQRLAAAASLQAALEGAMPLAAPSPAPSNALATLLDELVVLGGVTPPAGTAPWTPLPLEAKGESAAAGWLAMPSTGPQRVALPGLHTAAERGGKTARRRTSGAAPGDELFFACCTLMSAGAETALIGRWPVGGQSTLDLVREFLQELPETAASDAWQRSVQLAAERPVDPVVELRVRPGKETKELTAAHPFFWAGYLVIDSGWRPEEPVEEEPPAEPLADGQPAAPGDPPGPAPVAGEGQPASDNAPVGNDTEVEPPAAGDAAGAMPDDKEPGAQEADSPPRRRTVPPPPTPQPPTTDQP